MMKIDPVRKTNGLLLAVALGSVGFLLAFAIHTRAKLAPAAFSLTGVVRSQAQRPMEGVLVKAKRGTITITVVSDEQGRYAFPADKLSPGTYMLGVRAVGYKLPNSNVGVTVTSQGSTKNLTLTEVAKTQEAEQLQPAEWLMSVPSEIGQKHELTSCLGCHNITLPMQSSYDAAGFLIAIERMRGWDPSASVADPIALPYRVGPRPRDGALAKYLASVNLSSGRKTWSFDFKTFPRPAGEATKVIYTEYDLPRANAEPHDVELGPDGMIYYIDFAQPMAGRLDPRTGATKEWRLPVFRPGFPAGSLDMAIDKDGNLWIARLFQAGVAKLNVKTGLVTDYPIPKQYANAHSRTAFIAIGPDGAIWFDDTANRRLYFLNPATGKMVGYPAYPGWTWSWRTDPGLGQDGGHNHFMYGVTVDSLGFGYWADIGNRNIGKMDPRTGKTTLYPTPTAASAPRRMHVYAGPGGDDVIWFAENDAHRIGAFNTITHEFKEWNDTLAWDEPYDVVRDGYGYVWTGGMPTDYVTRLNPQTGEMEHYLIPTCCGVNVRRTEVDNLTRPPSMLFGENHHAKIILVQPEGEQPLPQNGKDDWTW